MDKPPHLTELLSARGLPILDPIVVRAERWLSLDRMWPYATSGLGVRAGC